MSKISIKGILIGGVVDVITSTVLGIPFGIYIFSKVDIAHTPKDQISAATAVAMAAHPSIHVAEMAVGLACSVLGGYVAAKLAKHDEFLNGTLSAFLCVLLGLFSIGFGKDKHPLAVQLLMLVASPICGLVGGYFASIQNSNRR